MFRIIQAEVCRPRSGRNLPSFSKFRRGGAAQHLPSPRTAHEPPRLEKRVLGSLFCLGCPSTLPCRIEATMTMTKPNLYVVPEPQRAVVKNTLAGIVDALSLLPAWAGVLGTSEL